jgi:hypothetical protein
MASVSGSPKRLGVGRLAGPVAVSLLAHGVIAWFIGTWDATDATAPRTTETVEFALLEPSRPQTPTEPEPEVEPTEPEAEPEPAERRPEPAERRPEPAERRPEPAERRPEPAERRPEPAERRPEPPRRPQAEPTQPDEPSHGPELDLPEAERKAADAEPEGQLAFERRGGPETVARPSDLGFSALRGATGGEPAQDAPSGAQDDRVASAEERLEGFLGASAEKDYLSKRPAPELSQRGDGSFVWQGPVLGARIAPDGAVRFSDGGASVDLDDQYRPKVRFGVDDAIARSAGDDPHYAERSWFLEQTEALRRRLARKARDTRAARGLARLRRRLDAVWSAAGRSYAQKRRMLFQIWDDCAQNERGERARRVVEGFVRSRLPAGSSEAYTRSELARLNRGRASDARFAPYGGEAGDSTAARERPAL